MKIDDESESKRVKKSETSCGTEESSSEESC